jgi:hypothetical protein
MVQLMSPQYQGVSVTGRSSILTAVADASVRQAVDSSW